MKILAVDARVAMPNVSPFSVAVWSDRESDYLEDWQTWRDAAAQYGADGYTMVTYGAEQAIIRLLYSQSEYVRVDYRAGEFVSARWHYDCNSDPMPIWDMRPLCGALTIRKLIEAVGLTPYETPQRYTWQHSTKWHNPCFDHNEQCCPLCWDKINRAKWQCDEHWKGECDACWRSQNAHAIYLYMARYARMAEGYGINPSRTVGGMAHVIWRHLDRPDPIRLSSREQDDFARRGYRAGRTECFKLGQCGPVTYGDVSQMYASILRDIELPTPASTMLGEGGTAPVEKYIWPGIVDATVRVPDSYVPILGIQSEQGFIFPTGTFRGHFTTTELNLALSRGVDVIETHSSLMGTERCRPFASFAEGMMNWREDLRREKDPLEIAVKLMLNSLYGMIGMKAWHETEYVMPLPAETTMADWPYHDIKVLKDHVLMRRSDLRYRRGHYANPLWAALITAAARVKLYLLMEQCGSELVYCDTDSIITMGELPEDVDEPGRMRYQGWFQESAILAPKMYRLQGGHGGQKLAHAGIPAWQIDRLIAEGKAKSGGPVGIMDSFHTGLEAGRWVSYQTDRQYSIGKRQPVNVATLNVPHGWTNTRPLILTMDMEK